ncbi:hypothetical protein EZV62_009808 [Acer yangbiense]|uniref:Uncharacterized protein n=1 Tax=Acer yangbiense TaxID=1000413 RepID=A0A5C7I176_9ROSI|nr:hypothetical protein EZV62_009808 [Acer yangbiense]
MVISGRAALLILLTLFRKTRGALASKNTEIIKNGFDFENDDKNNVCDVSSESVLHYVKVLDLETFLEKLSASEARNVLPEVGFRGEQDLMQTGNDEAPAQENSGPNIQLSKTTCSQKN